VKDAIVVGCGIIGATISAALRLKGLDVLTIDDSRPLSGTRPSGGHLKPSWFGGMKRGDYEPAMELLSDVWGLIQEEFQVQTVLGTFSLPTLVYRVDTDKVLAAPRTVGRVVSIQLKAQYPLVELDNGDEWTSRYLVVATGAWVTEFCPRVKVTPRQGVSFRFRGELPKPFIKPWAPYKQVVAHQQTDKEIWIGDGSAILPTNWDDDRTQKCLRRCEKALGDIQATQVSKSHGLRPYCEVRNAPCLFLQLAPRVWCVTGAGKLGTIAAGWAARKLLQEIV
jgi:glycine/D-amino acid oxidase-like deaminating enzyme